MAYTSISHLKRQSNIKFAWLLMAVYLLALIFTTSHNHQSQSDFRAELRLSFKSLNFKDHIGHWHSDQYHSASCQLISQTPADLTPFVLPVVPKTRAEVESAISLPRAFPTTKRLTRAPPVLS